MATLHAFNVAVFCSLVIAIFASSSASHRNATHSLTKRTASKDATHDATAVPNGPKSVTKAAVAHKSAAENHHRDRKKHPVDVHKKGTESHAVTKRAVAPVADGHKKNGTTKAATRKSDGGNRHHKNNEQPPADGKRARRASQPAPVANGHKNDTTKLAARKANESHHHQNSKKHAADGKKLAGVHAVTKRAAPAESKQRKSKPSQPRPKSSPGKDYPRKSRGSTHPPPQRTRAS